MNPWKSQPIIGQAPMDGVTDAAFRYITDLHGKPDVLFTEFVSVEGVGNGAVRLLNSFITHETNTPIIGQIYGTEPHHFYTVAIIVAELGFSGIDINMGCPDASISKRGAGAGLIRTPKLAQEIVRTVQKAQKDWSNGITVDDIALRGSIRKWVSSHKPKDNPRSLLPVSVKTRIGFDEITTSEWIPHLLEAQPAAITIHGRTLKQMYTGQANWEEIAKAAEMARTTETLILGNGDVHSRNDALNKIQEYGVNGVLIGRASFGNPWIFTGEEVSNKVRLETALEHCKAFERLTPEGHFLSLRKHLAWYCKSFRNSAHVRDQLMRVQSSADVEKILNSVISTLE
ncbi:hypothetical protein COY16_04800 [Candidatus Roizmanbacteria bacterium CG_4_10_14_0_2_um_filter_39_13]|uniref:tRNA-dihydrouridine synthase n=1 Tax=Candidatus Roizmanbacteria bacterium CG_4_10_14_0_2_um_filter_39_13 TaxID=1974825 RepID=A0A2M7TWT1_9BACT|nr:MAG: hypothetical protein COY16_04800 [Candidatus Roizmanbacteria bacterium CG_4_10_14_0_2_um_filter_39_13]